MPREESPVTLETARRLVAFNAAGFERFARAAHRLPWRVASGNKGTGHLSIFRTLVHILNVHEVWMLYIIQARTRELKTLFQQPDRRPTSWLGFDTYSKRVWTGIDRYVAALTPAMLSHVVKAPWMPGKYTVGDAVLQTTFEQAHHLGEIIGTYWQRDVEPPQMMWIPLTRPRIRHR
ncbi:MAG: DinB family protein [Thermoplasmata archaeon]